MPLKKNLGFDEQRANWKGKYMKAGKASTEQHTQHTHQPILTPGVKTPLHSFSSLFTIYSTNNIAYIKNEMVKVECLEVVKKAN